MAGGSKTAVYAAIVANSIVALTKLAGFFVTGSGAMLSEGIHSIADVGNQVLLAIGMKRAATPPDETHPGGYGREAFVWAMMSAVGIFFLGCGVTMTHGVQSLLHPEAHGVEEGGGMLNIGILIFALVAEGITLLIALRGMQQEAKRHNQGLIEHLRTTDDPFGVAVVLEDAAAVFGVLLALAAVGLTEWTHQPYWDAIGSITIGILLGFVALFLIRKNRELLIGRSVRETDSAKIREILESEPAVERVIEQRAMVTGADTFRITAELDFDGRYFARDYLSRHDPAELVTRLNTGEELTAFLEEFGDEVVDRVGDEVDRIENRLREALPRAQNIALEPD